MRFVVMMVVLMLACVPWTQASANTVSIEQQRQWFEQARNALDKNNMESFHGLKAKLADYPLTAYLDIWQAREELKQGHDALAIKVIAQHADVPETINLRVAWIEDLAKRKQWSKISQQFEKDPADIKRLPEIFMVSSWHNGAKERALQQFSENWIKGHKVSEFAEALQQNWLKQGHPTQAERWARIDRLALQGQWKQAKEVAKALPKAQQQWLNYWQNVQKQPEQQLAQWPAGINITASRMILADGLNRLSRIDPVKAWDSLQLVRTTADQGISSSFYSLVEKDIALRAARQHMQLAAGWLNALPVADQDEDTRAWQARLHILNQEWQKAMQVIDAMPQNEQQESNWSYWKARALEMLGEKEAAAPLYAKLAVLRGYYSFLSAERLGLPLQMSSDSFQASEAELTALSSKPAIIRAYEWLQLGNNNKASREWHFALAGSQEDTWETAATLAASWQWHDQVIRAAFKADRLDALESRFPLAHGKDVVQASTDTGLSPSAIWSIIRQESAFNIQATSYVGARGLMQLMPKTARATAIKLKLKSRHPDLFSPATNIQLGSAYLVEQKERFGSLALAAAAYNAGPHRVNTWLQRTPFDAPEAWVEAIPFNETRQYVQQVMAFVSVYEWRQEKTPSSLITRLNREQQVSLNQ
ncbi:MAG: hypothetical protein AUJ57_07575 [Zetaproteobacteria bacterium CG1_02_53_45]|nr:MAG: hypothetical protein AUJ57_07575 [Zetaproteobacteria bacterium CG1_02_53_45]